MQLAVEVTVRLPAFLPLAGALAALALAACFDDSCDSDYASSSCDQEICTPAPPSCRKTIPETGTLILKVSNPLPVLIRVYRGEAYETGTLVWSGVSLGNTISLEVPLNAYSATALYVANGDSLLSIDGGEVGYETLGTCDGNCYGRGSVELDLERE